MTIRNEKRVNRRAALEIFGVMGAAFAVGCNSTDTTGSTGSGGAGGSSSTTTGTTSTTGTTATAGSTGTGTATCEVIPEETTGPYPDKTGMLDKPAFFRQDVTEGKTGIPLAVTFTVVDVAGGCSAVSGAIVEIWHCDKDGVYSEYNGQPGVAEDESATTFLRGLQTTDSSGQVSFSTIYPGWYSGRATHIHVEVYVGGKVIKTTQMAFADATNTEVSSSALYVAKGQNPTTNGTDMVFSDGDEYQLANLSGDVTNGFKATLTIGT